MPNTQKTHENAPKDLLKLIEATRNVKMRASEFARQRESFAFGNASIENASITRETVRRVAAGMQFKDARFTRS